MEEMPGPKPKDLISVEPVMDHVVVGDRISELPWEIQDNILGRLPIKSAVATTILSRKWKDRWVDVSNLVFIDHLDGTKTMDSELFIRLVYHVLLSHRGTIDKFTFSSNFLEASEFYRALDHWIVDLSRKDIRELTICFCYASIGYSPISMPLSLFSCEQLRSLCLSNCCFWTPDSSILGFRALVSLHLTYCRCFDAGLEKMISGSPNLENLVLTKVRFKRLTICAPSLKYLSLEGYFGDVSLENCPLLDDASFKLTEKVYEAYLADGDWEDTVQGTSHNLVPPQDWLSCTRRLVMTGLFLKFLAERYNWHGASVDYHNLEVLELDTVHFDDLDEMAVTLSILRRASNLNVLIINGVGTYKKDIFRSAEALDLGKCCFNRLRLVRITILTKNDPPWVICHMGTRETTFLEVIRLLLAGSPVLENMLIRYTYVELSDLWFMEKLLSCDKASSQLKVTYTSEGEGKSTRLTSPSIEGHYYDQD